MMPREVTLFLFLILVGAAFAQPPDSLRTVANDATRPRADRVQALRILNHLRGLSAAELAAEPAVAEILGDTASGTQDGAWARLLHANLLFRRGEFARCVTICDRAEQVFASTNDELGAALTRAQKGLTLIMAGDQANAMRLYFSVLDVLPRKGLRYEEADALLQLAWLFNSQGDRGKAREYLAQAMNIARASGFDALEADAYRHEGNILFESGSATQAEERYAQAQRIYLELGGARRIAVVSTQLANVRMEVGDLPCARQGYNEALVAFKSANNAVWTSYVYSRLADVCHQMHEDRAALEYATEGLAIAQTHDLFKDSIDNLAVSQKIHAALGDYESALGSSQQYAAMRDSMASNGIATEMMELDLRQQEVKDSLEREEQRSHEKAIRALDGAVSRIPIIAMTANTMQADLDQCKAAGMDGYIPKPFKCEELIFALQHALIPERSVRP